MAKGQHLPALKVYKNQPCKENHQKGSDLFSPPIPQKKDPGKERLNDQKTKNSLQKKKQGNPKSEEKRLRDCLKSLVICRISYAIHDSNDLEGH